VAHETALQAYFRRSDDFHRYLLSDARRVRDLRDLVRANSRFFGLRVLDLGCGGGVLGFLLEDGRSQYLGVDANPDMIREARRTAKERDSRCRFVLDDVTRLRVRGKFDTVALWGNGICHLPTHDVQRMLLALRRHVEPGSTFLVEYRDVVRLVAERRWKTTGRFVIAQGRSKGRLVVTPKGVDTEKGVFPQSTLLEGFSRPVRWGHAIWSPFILEPLMKAEGWGLARRVPKLRDRSVIVDVYRFTGQ
jgi:SAM-dependent methyltransferase